jgi:fermentation-respiration switch protein FrsA (DUF1100 family)
LSAIQLSILLIALNMPAQAWIDRFIFFPERDLIASPADVRVAYEDVEFLAADGTRLHGWFVEGSRPETLLWFHGNAGNISHRIEQLQLLHQHVRTNLFLIDYRQYGRSSGLASETGLYADARGALEYLRRRPDIDASQIIYFGQSLGSAVAIDLAFRVPPRALILETPFTSVRDMARTLPIGPLAVLLPDMFNNLAKIPSIRAPKLFIHGDRDEIVPYAQGQRLFEAAVSPKQFFTIPGAGHNDTYVVAGARYFQRVREFVETAVRCVADG